MRVLIDIETNSLVRPSKIWVIVLKDIDTGEQYVFRQPTETPEVHTRFVQFAAKVTYWVGHNIVEFDLPVLSRLLGVPLPPADHILDTLVLSRLVDYKRTGNLGRAETHQGSDVSPATSASASDTSRSLPVRTTADDIPSDSAVVSGSVRVVGGDPGLPRPPRASLPDQKFSHSIESYGEEFGYPKIKFSDFTAWSQAMEDYCVRDVEIAGRIFTKYLSIINNPDWHSSILLEHQFQVVVNSLHDNGFSFNLAKAERLLAKVSKDLQEIDKQILVAFPPREVLIREFTPRLTKFGTISRTSVPRSLWTDISAYEAGKTYRHTRFDDFNPSSHKQVIAVLNEARWSPEDKTDTHIDTERELSRLKYNRLKDPEQEKKLKDKLALLSIYGWKINENNLSTLPPNAPASARLLAKRILLESRRRTLVEWLGLVQDDGRIHGKFVGLGAWTHRMAHQNPNTANIPNEFDISGKRKPLGKEMRSLWQAPKNRLLVGVDAEGIQLRVFAHYINDKEFTDALVSGRKDDKTDPHSLNQRILGSVCKTRAAAKRFIYALLLGAGMWKLAQILECPEPECQEALNRLLERYTGWQSLRDEGIPRDARAGYFTGLDGRKVIIPKPSFSERKHLCMSGYLQNGEAVIMKRATLKWQEELRHGYPTRDTAEVHRVLLNQDKDAAENGVLLRENPARPYQIKIVNFVHDEWQTETPNNTELALWVAETQSRALRTVGEELGLKCPLAGSYWNDDHKEHTIGTNWSVTH